MPRTKKAPKPTPEPMTMEEIEKNIVLLNQIKARLKYEFNTLLNQLRTMANKQRIGIISHDCNHAYSDQFSRDEEGYYMLYKGQMVCREKDEVLMENIPKHLIIRKGSKNRWPAMFGDWKNKPDYIYGGRITSIVMEKTRNNDTDYIVPRPEPIYRIRFTLPTEEKRTPAPFEEKWRMLCESKVVDAFNKFKFLLDLGFIPENLRIGEGIFVCFQI